MNRLIALVFASTTAWPAFAQSTLDLGHLPPAEALTELVWEHSPDLVIARSRIGVAEADVTRSELLINPSFDFAWSGVTVGQTNPAGLTLRDTPNYAFTLSQTFELGKRGPRQAAAQAARRAISYDVWETVRQRTIDVRVRAAEVASAEVRIEALSNAAKDAAKLSAVQQARASKGDASGLDADRARLEEQKLLSNLGEARENLQNALIECAHTAGLSCVPFGDPALAQAFLENARALQPALELTLRPDLQSLEAQTAVAAEQATLANRHAIPDPVVRVGYLRDQLVVAGNQPNSLFVGVTIPLPVFDHGQADAQAARVQGEAADRARTMLSELAHRDVERLLAQLELAKKRQTTLTTQTLPLARQVVDNLAKTVLVGGAPIQDLLIARRTLEELIVDSADVDLLVFRLTLSLDRVTGHGASVPKALEPFVMNTK